MKKTDVISSICYRYKPSEETLLEIDRFCLNIIMECDVSPSRRLTSRSLTPQTGGSSTTLNGSPLPVASFASGGLVKSLNYIRSLVAQHVPRRSFQPAAFAGATSASRQSLPSLSSLMSKSFNSQISPGISKEASEIKEGSAVSVLDSPIAEDVNGAEGDEFIASDVFKWRWHGDPQSSLLSSDRYSHLSAIACNFLFCFYSVSRWQNCGSGELGNGVIDL